MAHGLSRIRASLSDGEMTPVPFRRNASVCPGCVATPGHRSGQAAPGDDGNGNTGGMLIVHCESPSRSQVGHAHTLRASLYALMSASANRVQVTCCATAH
jgi:hypothetical protein